MTPWGLGINTEQAPPEDKTANGLIAVLGDEAFARASARLTNAVKNHWPEGMQLNGSGTISGDAVGLGELEIIYEDLWIEIGLIEVSAISNGLGAQLSIESPYVTVHVMDGDKAVCTETLSFHVLIDSQFSLGQDKYGRVESTLIDVEMVGVEKTNGDFGPCDYALGPVLFHDTMQEVGKSLSAHLSLTVGPIVEQSLPDALGINLAMDYSVSHGNSPAETGLARGRVHATSVPDETFWSYIDGKLIVPFSVALHADQALCVPEEPLPHPPSKLIPSMDGPQARVLLVNTAVAAKAFKVAWQTGLICDDRLAESVNLPAELLRNIWPVLESFGSKAPLSIRIWPQDNPEITFLTIDGTAWMRLDTGLMRMEVMVQYDDAWLRMATLDVTVEVEGPLLIDQDGSVLLDPAHVDVVTLQSLDGLHRAPNFEAIENLTQTLVESVVMDRSLFHLPPFATEAGQLQIELHGDYLSFNKAIE
jgi:hypothetical protein